MAIGQNRSRKSAQCDRWSFCLTAGTVWSAEVKKYFLPGISFVEFLHTRAIGEPAHWNNQSNSCLPLGARRRCSARSSILARRVTSHPCHADHVLSPRIVRIIQGLAEDWHRLDDRRSTTCRTRSQRLRGRMLGASGNAFSKGRDFAGRLGDRFQNSNHGDRSKMLQSPGTAISVRCAVRSPAPTESKTCWGRCIVSVAM